MTSNTTTSMSYGGRLSELARTSGDRVALVFAREDGSEVPVTFAELDRRSNQVARLLQAEGVDGGTTVAMRLANSVELVTVCYAAWKLGACTLPLNPRAPEREIQGMLDAAATSGRPVVLVSADPAAASSAGTAARVSLDAVRASTELDDSPLADVTPQPGKAIGSGGSTGRPKIIVDPRPWQASVTPAGVTDPFGRRRDHVVLIGGPLYHNGPFGPLFASLFDGTTVVLMERFDAARAVDLVERHRVNWTFMVPTQMARIARLPGIEGRDLSSFEGIYHAGAFCPEWVRRAWFDLIGPECLYEIFGSAEAVGVLFMRGDEWLEHPGTVGKADLAEVRILDDAGDDLPPGEVGEIFLRWKPATTTAGWISETSDPSRMYTYWGSEPMRTVDGFASAGDLGWLDEEGYLHLADRRVDLIITGGSNVYPAEVEDVISRLEDVVDVAVIGLPDDDWGQRVHAVVQVRPGAATTSQDLDSYCRTNLTPYKRPKTFELVELLPRDDSGKIRRSALVADRTGAGDRR